jgi:hypothetical protein
MTIEQQLAKRLDAMLMEALMGGPRPKQRQTALRVRGRSFEVVEIGDDGNVIEPPKPCCSPWGAMHAPNCKMWCT